jgi:hypothetical protein
MSRWTRRGQDYMATVRNGPQPGSTELDVIGQTSTRGLGPLQSVSWGETERLARRVLDRVDATLVQYG